MAQRTSNRHAPPPSAESAGFPRSHTAPRLHQPDKPSSQRRSTSPDTVSKTVKSRLLDLMSSARQSTNRQTFRSSNPNRNSGHIKTKLEPVARTIAKQESPTLLPSNPEQRSLEEVRESLAERESRLCSRLQKLETDTRRFQADIRSAPLGSSSEKAARQRALRCMKQTQALKRQLATTMRMMDNAAKVDVAREDAAISKDAVALHQALSKHPKAQDVSNMMDEQQELMDNVQEIHQVFATPFPGQDMTDDDLLRELEDDVSASQGREPHYDMDDDNEELYLLDNDWKHSHRHSPVIPNTIPMNPSKGVQNTRKGIKSAHNQRKDEKVRR